jgi:hypothetical protein
MVGNRLRLLVSIVGRGRNWPTPAEVMKMLRKKWVVGMAIALLALLAAGCDMTPGVKGELEMVLRAYGHALIDGVPEDAMRYVSRDYYDADGNDYVRLKNQLIWDTLDGDYLLYDVDLHSARYFGDTAWAMGRLTTTYRKRFTIVTIHNTETKEWTFRREYGRWRIVSQSAVY